MCRAVCAGEMTFPAASATGAGQAGDGAAAIRPFSSPGERDATDARRATETLYFRNHGLIVSPCTLQRVHEPV